MILFLVMYLWFIWSIYVINFAASGDTNRSLRLRLSVKFWFTRSTDSRHAILNDSNIEYIHSMVCFWPIRILHCSFCSHFNARKFFLWWVASSKCHAPNFYAPTEARTVWTLLPMRRVQRRVCVRTRLLMFIYAEFFTQNQRPSGICRDEAFFIPNFEHQLFSKWR